MRRYVIVIAFLSCMLLLGCTTANVVKQQRTVGALLPLSGPDAAFGEHLRKGLELGTRTNRLLVEDYGSSTTSAVSAANKLLYADRVDVLLTSFSEDTLAILPLALEAGVPVICLACGTPGLTEESNLLYRVWPSDELEVKALVAYAQMQGYGKAALIQTASVWEDALAQAFEKGWDGLLLSERVDRSTDDFKPVIAKIEIIGPDIIYLPVYEQKYPLLLRQLRAFDNATSVMATSWIGDSSILAVCGEACEGVIVPQYGSPAAPFVEAFKERYGQEPGIGADVAYDAARILEMIGDLSTLQSIVYTGASGTIEFDESGDRKDRQVDLFVIEDGGLVPLTR